MTPIFVVGSGRCGTALLARTLGIEHEYMVNIVQPLAVKRYHGLVSSDEAKRVLASTHGAAVHYAEGRWGDSSNKLSWLIPELHELFPTAKFIHLIRDGRKVCSSYLHKLSKECYDDIAHQVMLDWFDGVDETEPPPAKRYWWPVGPHFEIFTQFQRICWHWSEINRVILRDLAHIPDVQKSTLRLEDLPPSKPHNVNVPEDYPLTDEQTQQFWAICGGMMRTLGYEDTPEYRVRYG